MTRPDPAEVMAVIARRGRVLRAVDTDGVRKRTLVSELDVSRSTVDRSIRELESVGFIERADEGGYRRTLPGELALEEYDRFASCIDGVLSGIDVLSLLPADAPCDTRILDDATVVLAERHSPHVPVNHMSDLVARATKIWSVAPAVLPQQVSIYHERLTTSDLSARLTLTDAVVEHLVSRYETELREALATGNLDIRRTDQSLPYSLVAAETTDGSEMGLLVYAESGVRGFIGNDDPDAFEWAKRQVNTYWDAATPLNGVADGSVADNR
jgi:predicted transcriptional regulator